MSFPRCVNGTGGDTFGRAAIAVAAADKSPTTSSRRILPTNAMIMMPPSPLKGRLPRTGSPLRLKPASAGIDSASAEIAGFSRHLIPSPLGDGLFIFDLLRVLLTDDVLIRREVFCIATPIVCVVGLDIEMLEVVIELLENRLFPRP